MELADDGMLDDTPDSHDLFWKKRGVLGVVGMADHWVAVVLDHLKDLF